MKRSIWCNQIFSACGIEAYWMSWRSRGDVLVLKVIIIHQIVLTVTINCNSEQM